MSIPPAIQRTQHLGNVQAVSLLTDELTVGPAGTGSGAWKQTTATLTNGTLGGTPINVMRYQVVGKTCFFTLQLQQATAGVQGGTLLASLPVQANSATQRPIGSGSLQSDTNGDFLVVPTTNNATTMFFRIANQTLVTSCDATTAAMNNNGVWVLNVAGHYEIA